MDLRSADRLARVRTFLKAMCHPRIASAMSAYGFEDENLEEGWTLLHRVGQLKREDHRSASEAPEPSAVGQPSAEPGSALEKADRDLWAWYLHWTQVARVAVIQRALLKEMGLVRLFSFADTTMNDEAEKPADSGKRLIALARSLPPRSSNA
jgi:hypothetical protein